MRPPPQRNYPFRVPVIPLPPRFGTQPGPVPAAARTYYCPDNSDSLLKQSCISGHEKQVMPLVSTNRYRSLKLGDYSRSAPAPKLERQNNPPSRPLVHTFE